MYRIVIPARFAATRLPGKPLLALAGKPMIQWVYERARRSSAGEVIIATDDERIADVARGFGAEVVMTAASHVSGTDRIAEVAHKRAWPIGAIIVNVQGDEPLIPVPLIEQASQLLMTHTSADMGTLAARISSAAAFADINVVKVVTDVTQRALYFSRAPIPCDRDQGRDHNGTTARTDAAPASFAYARRHIGIYAYRVGALLRLAALKPTPLEQLEKLEQLRALENGFDIRVADCVVPPGADVNTRADLARVEALLKAQP
jgi:3-deoxy-manno-octulosonate cytidylyltransferase (CMP-KDO synthetase)